MNALLACLMVAAFVLAGVLWLGVALKLTGVL